MLIAAKDKGYYATEDGGVFDKNDKELLGSPLKTSTHLRITLYADGVNEKGYCSVLKHRFIAYYFLGDEVFNHPLVRHLNDVPNDNRINNLVPGSFIENRKDIPKSKLSNAAKKNAHLLVERSRKLADADITCMRKLYNSYKISYKNLSELFGVSTMTAFRAVSGQSWKEVA
jgi:hypothetical protein